MTAHDPAAVQTRLWDEIEKRRTGMLGLMADGQHFQPMTAFREEETGTIWFFTRDDTDLARDVASPGGQSAMFHYGSKDQHVWACVAGQLSVQGQDREIIDRYWNPVLAAWYPDGKDDPHLTVLRFDAEEARVWVQKGGLMRFAFEIAKANATGTRPDLGERRDLNFH